jgi:hypothetical protein
MESVTRVLRRDKKLFPEGVAVNRFVLPAAAGAAAESAAGFPAAAAPGRGESTRRFHPRDVYTSIYPYRFFAARDGALVEL